MKEVVEAFFKSRNIINHQLASFNDFLPTHDNPKSRMQRIIDSIRIGEVDNERGLIRLDVDKLDEDSIDVKLGRITVGTPIVKEANGATHELTPMEARLRDLTYSAPIFLEVTIIENGIDREPEKVKIGDLPIMVKSKRCNLHREMMSQDRNLTDDQYYNRLQDMREDPLDPGGYFIINGTERSLISLEDLSPNRVLVEWEEKYGTPMAVAKVFSQREGFRALTSVELKKDGILMVSVPAAPTQIPLIILMKALGMDADEDIAKAIVSDERMNNIIFANLEECSVNYTVNTIEDALNYLEKKFATGQAKEFREKKVESIIDKSLLPHLGDHRDQRIKKAIYLGRIARSVLELKFGQRDPDDKDHYANKRISLAGDLMEDLFRVAFTSLMKDLKYQLERTITRKRKLRVSSAIRPDVLSQRIIHALATGNWVGGRDGVSQLLDRTCNMSTISHMRRITSPLTRSQPHFEARDLHPTQWGRLCPNETPEGQNCGLVKNLALIVDISEGYDDRKLESTLFDMGVRRIEKELTDESRVYLNGNLIGIHHDPEGLVESLRKRRRQGFLAMPQEKSHEINVRYNQQINSVIINCDDGRVRRPLFVLERGQTKLTERMKNSLIEGKITWEDLVQQGIIEWIDAEEEEDLYISLDIEQSRPDHTHMEIDPMVILGTCSGLVCYPHHNSSPRITMGAGMAKQSLGLGASNFRIRCDTRAHLLHYPQKPLVQTKTMDFVNFNTRPGGQNFVVAVMSYQGYNMEDALIFNRASIERGLGRSTFIRTYPVEERRYPGGQEDRIEIPQPDVMGSRTEEAYNNLDEDGIISPEFEVLGKDVLIGRTSPPRFLEEHTDFLTPRRRRETSLTVRPRESGYVDTVMITESENGLRLVKVTVRSEKIPEVGDKFASRHGQKGVIGLITNPEDMPFNEDGIIPDLVTNPHAIPSRMTVAHVLEMIGGKVGSMQGRTIDGTAFSGEGEDSLRDQLLSVGFKSTGKEIMYDPFTGKKLRVEVFKGVIYYQKLHHMVSGKMHVRSRGPVQILTRQPTEGRSRQGGLRFGEMERDCLIAHGVSMVIKDRLLDESDGTIEYVCGNPKCGNVAMLDKRGALRCPVCGETGNIHPVQTSYAFKLLMDELKSMCVAMRLHLEDLN
ncbi:MAG: DNA-directed RNA polymerase subunit B [Candidatus Thermoplasmatota archaeon]|nr:DNA-directed RNA polymerase subunit B [Candidatus Thermoplasmatota archaeon]